MALFFECMLQCARKKCLTRGDIVREAMLQQLTTTNRSAPIPQSLSWLRRLLPEAQGNIRRGGGQSVQQNFLFNPLCRTAISEKSHR